MQSKGITIMIENGIQDCRLLDRSSTRTTLIHFQSIYFVQAAVNSIYVVIIHDTMLYPNQLGKVIYFADKNILFMIRHKEVCKLP